MATWPPLSIKIDKYVFQVGHQYPRVTKQYDLYALIKYQALDISIIVNMLQHTAFIVN